MNKKPIGIFDSGLGGLTALAVIHELLPGEDILYFADTARCPYGAKTPEQLRRMAAQDIGLLSDFGAKAVLAACGTVSSTAADVLASSSTPVTGVLIPAVKAMAQIPGTAPLAVIATAASIGSGAFQQALETACPGREIIAVACPDFVTLIESGHTDASDPLVRKAVASYLEPVKEAGAAALLLGCTHYGIIAEAITDYLGPQVQLISASKCAAQKMQEMLETADEMSPEVRGTCRFFTSGSAEEFSKLASTFLPADIPVTVTALPPMEL